MSMTCQEFRDHLSDHHAGELVVEIKERFEVHRATCAHCGPYHESYTHTVKITAKLPKHGPLPPAVEARLREVLKDYLGK
ncbi:MAG: zf-HC2 domain-containing protein [Gemmataceae bacterium]|nr:zf-HC2 domain-containing protein [Gemmataceae bacterium]